MNVPTRSSATPSQPPCEAVSWNINEQLKDQLTDVSLLVRLWVEMSRRTLRRLLKSVSLLVRLWVEIGKNHKSNHSLLSASLWGCELKLLSLYFFDSCNRSASLWGCELKYRYWLKSESNSRQPPCEAVSWNIKIKRNEVTDISQPPCEAVSWNKSSISLHLSNRSASLWGCELKYRYRAHDKR